MCRGEERALNLLLYSRKHRFSHHNSDRCPSSVTLRTAESAKSPLPIRQNSIHHHALFSVYSKGLWLNALFTTCLPRAGGWGNSRLWWLTKPNDVKAPAMGLSRSTSQETPVKCLLASLWFIRQQRHVHHLYSQSSPSKEGTRPTLVKGWVGAQAPATHLLLDQMRVPLSDPPLTGQIQQSKPFLPWGGAQLDSEFLNSFPILKIYKSLSLISISKTSTKQRGKRLKNTVVSLSGMIWAVLCQKWKGIQRSRI